MSQPRERVSLTLPPEMVRRLELSRRELSKLTGCELSTSQIVESLLQRDLPALNALQQVAE